MMTAPVDMNKKRKLKQEEGDLDHTSQKKPKCEADASKQATPFPDKATPSAMELQLEEVDLDARIALKSWLTTLQTSHKSLSTSHQALFTRYYAIPYSIRNTASSDFCSATSDLRGAEEVLASWPDGTPRPMRKRKPLYKDTMWGYILEVVGEEWLGTDEAPAGQLFDAEDFLHRAEQEVGRLEEAIGKMEREKAGGKKAQQSRKP